MKRILLAEDHIITQEGTKHVLLKHLTEVEIFTVENFEEALNIVSRQILDLLILDVEISGEQKLNMIEVLRIKNPKLPILVFSGLDENLYALPLLRAGADGYLHKSSTAKEFIEAIEIIFSNKKYLSPQMIQQNIRQITQSSRSTTTPLDMLTKRETEVIYLLARGNTNSQISRTLFLSKSAISIYKSKAFQKLGLKNVIELSAFLELNG
jgi:two-component system invasion response regulator UvrY